MRHCYGRATKRVDRPFMMIDDDFKTTHMTDQILFPTDGNDMPQNFKAGYFNGFDGRKLRYALFKTSGMPVKGTIILLHGRNESIEKYFETITTFTNYGFWVATFDWRGQGGSERLLDGAPVGHIERLEDYEKDLKIFLNQIALPDGRAPFFGVAHSTGGLVLLSAAPDLGNSLDRIVVTAPFLDIKINAPKRFFSKIWIKLGLLFGFGKRAFPRKDQTTAEQFENLTNDWSRFERNHHILTEYPEFAAGPPTYKWIAETVKYMKRVRKQSFLETIKVPTIILAGTEDGIVPYQTLEAVSTRFRAGHIIPFFGARHELLHETDIHREPAIAAIHGFFDRKDEAA